MIEIIHIFCLIIIIKSEVWTITNCLRWGHETMVCAVCLFVLLLFLWHHNKKNSWNWKWMAKVVEEDLFWAGTLHHRIDWTIQWSRDLCICGIQCVVFSFFSKTVTSVYAGHFSIPRFSGSSALYCSWFDDLLEYRPARPMAMRICNNGFNVNATILLIMIRNIYVTNFSPNSLVFRCSKTI